VGDQVQVDGRVGPGPQRRQVGDRGHRRRLEQPARSQLAEHQRRARIGGDDDVRAEGLDRGEGSPPGEHHKAPVHQSPGRAEIVDEPEDPVEDPAAERGVELRAADRDRPHQRH
jgi:hypothetical protein